MAWKRMSEEHRRNREIAIMLDEETYQGAPCKYGHPGKRIVRYHGQCWHCYRAARRSYTGSDARPIPAETTMYRGAKHRAKALGLPFDLKPEDIVIPSHCPISGKPMTQPSLDRKDNTKGYVRGNVFVISWEMNRLKDKGTIEDFENILRYMRE